jgi:hypothetical protein
VLPNYFIVEEKLKVACFASQKAQTFMLILLLNVISLVKKTEKIEACIVTTERNVQCK